MECGDCTSEPQEILVLGGSGFVGPAVVRRLLSAGLGVTLLNRGTRSIAGTRSLLADRNSEEQLGRAVRSAGAQYRAVVDLSCYDDVQAERAWRLFSHKTRLWVHVSSAAIYVDGTVQPPKESDETGGACVWGAYGSEKSRAEDFLSGAATAADAVSVVSLRPPYIYGPGNNLDRESFVWRRALAGQPVFIPGAGKTPIQFLHVDDLAALIGFLIEEQATPRGFHCYNVAADPVLTHAEWVKLLCQIAGAPDVGILAGDVGSKFSARQYFPFRDYPCWVNADKIRHQLGWAPRYNAPEGFQQTFAASVHDHGWRSEELVRLNDAERAISAALHRPVEFS